jgi:hypothetical protein
MEEGSGCAHGFFILPIFLILLFRDSELLTKYIDKKLERPTMQITKAEFLKGDGDDIDEGQFLTRIKDLGQAKNFDAIEEKLKSVQKK